MMGGIRRPERRHMASLFSLIIGWAVLATLALVLLPYGATRWTDSVWQESRSIWVWSALIAVSIAHGIAAFLMVNSKGGSPNWFFVGAIPGIVGAYSCHLLDIRPIIWGGALFPLSLVFVAMKTAHRPTAAPPEAGALQSKIDRLFFVWGNIWFGISQLAVMLMALLWGTIHETKVGGNMGNEAAYAEVYNVWWFGILVFLFFVTIYCATMRKYPFRVSQIGWLTVHTGLLLMCIGCMAMHWGSFTGNMQLFEGQSSSTARSLEERELLVNIPSADFNERFPIDCDRDPEKEDVEQEMEFEVEIAGRTEQVQLTIDRYYSRASEFDRLVSVGSHAHDSNDPNHRHTPGAVVKVNGETMYLLEDEKNWWKRFFNLQVMISSIVSESEFKGLTHRYAKTDNKRGTLSVKSKDGKLLASVDITPGPRSEQGAPLEGQERRIEGDITVKPLRYFSSIGSTQSGFGDRSPGQPSQPSIFVEVTGPKGSEKWMLFYNGVGRLLSSATEPIHDLKLEYHCTPEIDYGPGTMLVALGPGSRRSLVINSSSAGVRVENLELKKEYSFSKGAPVKVEVDSIYDNAKFESGLEPTRKQGAFRAIHVSARYANKFAEGWITQHSRFGTTLQLGGIQVQLGYMARELDLDFGITCLDFRRFNYANSSKPAVYETNIILDHPAEGIDEAVLIDMNHPLKYGGYRFFNSSPIYDKHSNRRGVVLMVTSNPGYPTIITAAIVISLGLIIVLFFKPKLKQWESRRRQANRDVAKQPLDAAAVG